LLLALLRTLWRLSYQDMRDWLHNWHPLALACGLLLDAIGTPRIPSSSQQWKRGHRDGVLGPEALFCLTVQTAIRRRLIVARDLIIDSAPILAWSRTDPDAAAGPYYQTLLLMLASKWTYCCFFRSSLMTEEMCSCDPNSCLTLAIKSSISNGL
jgi:hypothetical protein